MIFSFDRFRLDTDRHELLRDGQGVDVEPQVFAVLRVLIEKREKVVTKDELIVNIWQGRVMSDAAISSRIKSARQAIGDDGKSQRLIKTVHGIGFRFVGDIQAASTHPAASTTSRIVLKEQEPTPSLEEQRPSIVVLPFALLAHNGEPSVFAQGLAHDIITGLSRLRWLKVIARASSFQLNTQHSSLADVRQLTGADYCLTGMMEISERTIAINLELIDMRDQTVMWADRLAGSRDDIHQVRSDIIQKAANAMELQVSTKEAQDAQLKAPENLDAWEAYHLGVSHLYRMSARDNQQAANYFRHAITIAPEFARAHAGLSAAEFFNAFNQYQGIDIQASTLIARDSAERSISLDRLDPWANFVMGRIHWLTNDVGASLPWLERSTQLNPNYAQGHYAHGLASIMSSDSLRGYNGADQAISLSPLDPLKYGFLGLRAFSYIADGDHESAMHWGEQAARQPEAAVALYLIAAASCELAGDNAKALDWVRRASLRKPDISSDYLFEVLPFSEGKLRQCITGALSRCGL